MPDIMTHDHVIAGKPSQRMYVDPNYFEIGLHQEMMRSKAGCASKRVQVYSQTHVLTPAQPFTCQKYFQQIYLVQNGDMC